MNCIARRLIRPNTLPPLNTTLSPHTGVAVVEPFFDGTRELGITTVDKYNRREMIFHKVVIPSSQFVTFLISNRYILNGDLFFSFMSLLRKLPEIGPFHRPTLEFVLASPIVMALSSCLSFIDNDDDLWTTLIYINLSLEEWNEEDPEVVKSGKQIIQTLFSEGFEDTLEQKLLNDKNGLYGFRLVADHNRRNQTTQDDSAGLHGDNSAWHLVCAEENCGAADSCRSKTRSHSEAMKIVNRSLNRRSDSDSGEWPNRRPFHSKQQNGLHNSAGTIGTGMTSHLVPVLELDSTLAFSSFITSNTTRREAKCSDRLFAMNENRRLFLSVHRTLNSPSSTIQNHCLHMRCYIIAPKWDKEALADQLVRDLVPSSAGSPSGFVNSIVTLVSSPHSTVVVAALSFLLKTLSLSSSPIRCQLVESDLISEVLAIIQPLTLPISGNEEIFDNLLLTINYSVSLASPSCLRTLGVTSAVNQFNHREMFFQKVVLPSSELVTFLISNRHILSGWLFHLFTKLLAILIRICPFHRPTLEFVLASPIVMAITSCLSYVEDDDDVWTLLNNIKDSLREWKNYGPEVVQCGQRMMQALFSEGFEDTLEQKLLNDKNGLYGFRLVARCLSSQTLLSLLEPSHKHQSEI
ncbi:hypothetical protein BLNAU_2105 [Blattamonas nauphoetae]|uniref:Uncharacterized protein n=1 Tax=Blattamonas nauphoetae TaxID=2049346 RepID=A0ABQ9YH44_9EUKA|nr:hypothetical protein BLNAU_2105 [Blattamonas nauphoetae]